MGLLLAGFQVVLILVAGSIQRSGGFEQLANLMPPFARELMGPSMASFMSFAGIVCLGYFHLAVMASLIGLSIAIATMPTSEVESGFIDLLLARPVARHWIITRSIVATLLTILVLLAMMSGGTWGGLETLASRSVKWPSSKLIFSLVTNLGLLLLCWGGVALAIGAASRRRAVASSITGLLVLAMFLLDYVGRLWKPAETIAWLSPFRYYNAFELVMGRSLPLKNLLVLGSIAAAGFAAAYALFARRDISR
jgi:ABC-2 type transport system permease protein